MEKFAVDLDAVLDEFEFHEDQVDRCCFINTFIMKLSLG